MHTAKNNVFVNLTFSSQPRIHSELWIHI